MKKFIQVIRALLKSWKLWIFFPILSMLVVFYLTRNQKRSYLSSGTVNVNLDLKSGLSLTGEALKQYEIGLRFQNIIETVKSKRNFEIVRFEILKDAFNKKHEFISFINAPEIIKYSTDYDSYMNTVLFQNKLLDVRDKKGLVLNSILEENGFSYENLIGSLSVFRTGSSNILQISMKADDPFKAAYLTEKVIQVLIDQNRKNSKHLVGQNRQLFEKLVKSAKQKLDHKVAELEAYKIGHNIINLGEHTKAIANQLVNMRIKLANLKVSKMAQKKALKHVKATFVKGNPLPISTQTNHEILKINTTLKDLHHKNKEQQFDINHFKNDSLETRINNNKDRLSQLITSLIDDVPYDLKATRQDLVNRYIEHQLNIEMQETEIPILNKQIAGVMEFATHFAPLESNISTFEREIDVAQKSYLLLLNKLNLATTLEQGAAENEIAILDYPLVPLKPLKSKRALLILASGIAVGILIVGFITAIELLDANISTVSDYKEVTRLPLLASIPNHGILKLNPQNHELEQSIDLISQQQIKAIRKHLIEKVTLEKLILITSNYKEEGKLWVVEKINKLLIKTGFKVLVINADWMSSKTDENRLKLLDIDLTDITSDTESGAINMNQNQLSPFDYFNKQKWSSIKEHLNKYYDFIFIISPPMSISTDWQEWAEIANYNINIFKANRVFNDIDKNNESSLSASKPEILGTVFNKVDIDKMEGFIGDIKKKRSWIRKTVKNIFHRNFKGS